MAVTLSQPERTKTGKESALDSVTIDSAKNGFTVRCRYRQDTEESG